MGFGALGFDSLSFCLAAFALGFEVTALELEALTFGSEAFALRFEPVALGFEALTFGSEALARGLVAIACFEALDFEALI